MPERSRFLEAKKQYDPDIIDSAFDLVSGGMGIHLHAVFALATHRPLAEWGKQSVITYSANYLVNPYVFDWVKGDFSSEVGLYTTTPRNNAHIRLLRATQDEYARLNRAQLRLVLGGEETIASGNIEAPLTDANEFKSLLVKANVRGFIQYDPRVSPDIEIADNAWRLARNLARVGIQESSQLWVMLEEIWFSNRFRSKTLQIAIHKLGCMLAITDQLTFNAKALGIPYSTQYKPARETGVWESNWQKTFSEPMPGLGELYKQAHAVLIRFSDAGDPVLKHLFHLNSLPQLTN